MGNSLENSVAAVEQPAAGEQTVRFAVNPHLRVVFTSNDEVLVKHSGRSPISRIIRDDGRTKLLGAVLRNIKEHGTLDALLASGTVPADKKAEAEELFAYLIEEQVLVPSGEDVIQVFLGSILGGTQPVGSAVVGLVGAGYLGSRVAEELARLPVGELHLLDDRRVEKSAIDRRFFRVAPERVEDDRPFTDLVADHLQTVGPARVSRHLESRRDRTALRELFAQCQLVILASESLDSSLMHTVNEVALETGKPWLCLHIDGSEAFIGPLFVPMESACYNEYQVQHEATCVGVKDEYLTYKEALDDPSLGFEHLTFPAYLEVAAGMAAVAAARYLISGKSFLVGRSLRFDFDRLGVDTEEILRLPRCPACAPYRPYRHAYL
jgi:bacteriocin biosynthesis cyclodehydratase domain-containing protein